MDFQVRKRLINLFSAYLIFPVVAVLVISSASVAQTSKPPQAPQISAKARTPNLSGVWRSLPATYTFTDDPPAMQPWAEEKFKQNRNSENPNGRGNDELEPRYNCMPPGLPDIWLVPAAPFEIIQSSRRVLILYEWDHWVRQIWTDGRGHPKGFPVTWMGHSTGSWHGDTLVVDTVGINESTWLDRAGHVHSDALHVVERFRRIDRDNLEIEVTLNDPKAYTKPWGGKKVFKRGAGWELMEHVVCQDRFQQKAPQ